MTAASAWEGLRVVVVDTETTGREADSRIISVALKEIRAGRIVDAFTRLVDPGLSVIGAREIHGISAAILRDAHAPTFREIAAKIRELLTPDSGEVVLLAGYNVAFDARRLRYEFGLMAEDLPAETRLLDVGSLARKLGRVAGTLEKLAAGLGITQDDAHNAESDARTAAVALLRLVKDLERMKPGTRLGEFAKRFDPNTPPRRTRSTGPVVPPLSGEHLKAHAADLIQKQSRERALAVCVAEGCVELASRCEDSVTPGNARVVLAWIEHQLLRPDLTRRTRGRLLAGLGRVVAHINDPARIREAFDFVCEHLPRWGGCGGRDKCDRCADPGSNRLCHFRSVRYAIIRAFMYEDGELSARRAVEFLPFQPAATRRPGRPPAGWFHKLVRQGDADAAGYGAQLAAQAGAQSRTHGWERGILEYAWARGSRNAELADRYSARIRIDGSTDKANSHLTNALDVIASAFAGRGKDAGSVWESLAARRARILAHQSVPRRRAPATRRNRRAQRPNRFVVASTG